MSWLARFLGGRLGTPKAALLLGFFWKKVGDNALASAPDWSQNVARESFRRAAIKRVAGNIRGAADITKIAVCVATASRGKPAVQIIMDDTVVGWIPDEDATQFHAELLAIAHSGRATAKGHISAGSEGADYRVRLSVLRPLRLRTA